MKRAIFLLIPILVFMGLAAVLLIAEASRPTEWRVELDRYLVSRDASRSRVTVHSVARAGKPWNFSRDMGRAVLSESQWTGVDLPFPPEEIRCVLLKRNSTSRREPEREMAYQVVFLSYHTDRVWNHGWVVHEGVESPFAPAFIESLAAIGCDLGLEEMKPGEIQPIVLIGGEYIWKT
jgi:hypothetical protein